MPHQLADDIPPGPAYLTPMDGATLTKRGISVLRRLVRGAPGDVALAAVAASVQID